MGIPLSLNWLSAFLPEVCWFVELVTVMKINASLLYALSIF